MKRKLSILKFAVIIFITAQSFIVNAQWSMNPPDVIHPTDLTDVVVIGSSNTTSQVPLTIDTRLQYNNNNTNLAAMKIIGFWPSIGFSDSNDVAKSYIQSRSNGSGDDDLFISTDGANTNGDIVLRTHTNGYIQFYTDNTERMRISQSGGVGIGDPPVTSATYKLQVCGKILAEEVRVQVGWCDYVLNDNYELRSLQDVKEFIKKNKHLPDVTPGSIIEEEGLQLGETSSQMIKKIEENTLYLIQHDEQIDVILERLEKLEKENINLKKEIASLKKIKGGIK